MLLHYLVKYISQCTVNNVYHAVPNDQQTILQFIDILNTQLVVMPFMMPQIVYVTRLRSGLFDPVDMNSYVCLLQKPHQKSPKTYSSMLFLVQNYKPLHQYTVLSCTVQEKRFTVGIREMEHNHVIEYTSSFTH